MKFEGQDFSTIQDDIPGKPWDGESFFNTWRESIRERLDNNDNLTSAEKDEYVKLAEEHVIKHFYSIYQQILELIEAEKFSNEERDILTRKINLAMNSLSEFGQRSCQNITLSLGDKKLSDKEVNADFFNTLIDLLIKELREMTIKFGKILQEK